MPGLSTCIVRPHRFDPATHLPQIAAAGFQSIELNCFLGSDDFPWDRPARVRELLTVADDTGIRIDSVHAEGGLGAYRGDRSEAMAIDILRVFGDLAAELGATVIPFHAGLDSTQAPDDATAELQSSLETLTRHAADLPVRFGWENEPLGLSTAQHLAWIRELETEAICFVLDNGHSHIAGTTQSYLENCGSVLGSLHLNDNDGARDAHLMPGAGSYSWHGFMPWLRATPYTGPLMLEIEARDRQDQLPGVLQEIHAAVTEHILNE